VRVDSYNLELRSKDGFIGDRASKKAFAEILQDWRDRFARIDDDPFGEQGDISKKKLDETLLNGDPQAAGVVHGAIEDFAQEFAAVTRRFLQTKEWSDTQKIAVGGGFRNSRIGEVAIGRAAVLLKADGVAIDLVPIKHHPDEAGLLGSVQLLPSWALSGHDGLLAVDIGGTNIRAGIILTQLAKASDLSASKVWKSDLWRHRDDSPKRDEAVARLNKMLQKLLDAAKDEKLKIAPVIGIGCPGVIEPDGTIDRGGQNLPGGDWEGSKFNLPNDIFEAIPTIGDHDTHVIMHNDAVVQGLSQVPFMSDVERWGVLTIGTGLGNARFTNIAARDAKKDEKEKAKRPRKRKNRRAKKERGRERTRQARASRCLSCAAAESLSRAAAALIPMTVGGRGSARPRCASAAAARGSCRHIAPHRC
jgi:predicted NBD/HSP70 family sugar kinase